MKNHITYDHPGSKPFKCSVCDTKFTLESELKNHFGSVHKGMNYFKYFSTCGCPKSHLTSIIDHAYLSLSETAELFVLDDAISDHQPILVNSIIKAESKSKLKTIFIRDITRIQVADFEAALELKDWSSLYEINDVNH